MTSYLRSFNLTKLAVFHVSSEDMADTTSTSLLCLYPSILCTIFVEWIQDFELCCLDTAVCNSGLRGRFLDMLMKCNLAESIVKEKIKDNMFERFEVSKQFFILSYYEWIEARKLRKFGGQRQPR